MAAPGEEGDERLCVRAGLIECEEAAEGGAVGLREERERRRGQGAGAGSAFGQAGAERDLADLRGLGEEAELGIFSL
ncbi:MAG: hypothetical protein AAFY59_19900, partial [Pseudomonadota bacterium]